MATEQALPYTAQAPSDNLEEIPKYFRFLQLPAELRNNVYAQILDMDAERQRQKYRKPLGVETAILRINKQIYKEAESILYSINELQATIACSYKIPNGYGSKWNANKWDILHPVFKWKATSVCSLEQSKEVTSRIPSRAMRKFRSVKINLQFRITNADIPADNASVVVRDAICKSANHGLFAFISGLLPGDEPCLKRLTIQIERPGEKFKEHYFGSTKDYDVSDEDLKRILWPMSLVGGDVELKGNGISEDVMQYMRLQAAKTSSLGRRISRHDLVQMQLRLSEVFAFITVVQPDGIEEPKEMQDLAERLSRITRSKEYITEPEYEEMERCVEKGRSFFDERR